MSVFLAVMLQAAVADPNNMQLICRGGGSANKATVGSVFGMNNRGGMGWGTVTGTRSDGFDDQVDVRIDGENSRIRVPRNMVPSMHGGEKGWFKLKDLQITEDAITGSAALNTLNNPKVHIDRRTGSISIDGRVGHFSGQCDRFDPEATARRF